jgi:secondary thiamine-phosphate synthase enzyme
MCSSLAGLDISKQGQNEEDDEDRPESARRIVAPPGAVGPRGQGADNQNDQNDEYDKTHYGLCLGRPVTRASRQRQNRRTVPNATSPVTACPEMRQFTDILSISTGGRGLVEITRDILNWLKPYDVQAGLLTLFCRHTSAGLLIQENAAPDVRADLETFFDSLAPEDAARYRHADEGADDMPAHIRTALTGMQLAIPILHGRLALGTWQGIYLFEHRRSPHRREIALHLIGE